MMRTLWTAASGMMAQQTNVDTIANNISNVNTNGFKSEQAEFKSLLYQTLQSRSTSANGDEKPISAQVGLGTRLASITSNFTQGSMLESPSATAFAMSGTGFFGIQGADGTVYYTRNGDFKWSLGVDGITLATSDGYPVLNSDGEPIVLPDYVSANDIRFTSKTGEIGYLNAEGEYVSLDMSIGAWQFNNAAGLEKIGNSLYAETDASGLPLNESTTAGLTKSDIINGFLEGSNVQIADEMVDLIVAQRAYEMNSKAIQAADEMLGQANSLRR